MTPDNQLESVLNFELVEELELFFANKDKNQVIESLLVFSEKTFSLIKSQTLSLTGNQHIWIGISGYQGRPQIKVKIIEGTEYSKLHQMYRTDANIIVGPSRFDIKSNSFLSSNSLNFLIESWEGSMSGSYDPFKVTNDNFRYKKSA